MRDAAKKPEPVPKKAPKAGNNNLFVIQEHHARRLHYDLRLECDGVLVKLGGAQEPARHPGRQPPGRAYGRSSPGVL